MEKNVKIIVRNCENNDSNNGFDIYLDFSGQQEYLMHHRHNGLLFELLRENIYVDELRRVSPKQMNRRCNGGRRQRQYKSEKLAGMTAHLLRVIDEYITVRELDRMERDFAR